MFSCVFMRFGAFWRIFGESACSNKAQVVLHICITLYHKVRYISNLPGTKYRTYIPHRIERECPPSPTNSNSTCGIVYQYADAGRKKNDGSNNEMVVSILFFVCRYRIHISTSVIIRYQYIPMQFEEGINSNSGGLWMSKMRRTTAVPPPSKTTTNPEPYAHCYNITKEA